MDRQEWIPVLVVSLKVNRKGESDRPEVYGFWEQGWERAPESMARRQGIYERGKDKETRTRYGKDKATRTRKDEAGTSWN